MKRVDLNPNVTATYFVDDSGNTAKPKGKPNLPSLEKKYEAKDNTKVSVTEKKTEEIPKVEIAQPTIKPFTASNAYQEAMNYTNSLLEKLSAGKTSHTDRINSLMQQIQNREDFSYDMNTDTMFQQYLAGMMNTGKQAMQDTIGQASALTGGYGSTYAQNVGNQAYNAYLQEAMGVLPEYYQMAMDAYNAEGQKMYNELGMLTEADAKEYGRMQDAWSANFNNAQQMYQNEYSKWQDEVSNAYNSANFQLQAQNQAFNQENALYEKEYQKALDEANYMAGLSENSAENINLTQNEIEEMRRIFKEAGGGEDGQSAVDAYLTLIGKNVFEGKDIDNFLGINGNSWSFKDFLGNIVTKLKQ